MLSVECDWQLVAELKDQVVNKYKNCRVSPRTVIGLCRVVIIFVLLFQLERTHPHVLGHAVIDDWQNHSCP